MLMGSERLHSWWELFCGYGRNALMYLLFAFIAAWMVFEQCVGWLFRLPSRFGGGS